MSFVADIEELVESSLDGRLSCPPGCSRIKLGSVAQIVNGFPFPSAGFGTHGAPVIRIRDVVKGSTSTRYNGPIPPGYWVEKGDLLVGMDGDFYAETWKSDRALLNQRVCKIIADSEKIDNVYLSLILPAYLQLINNHTSSITVKHLSSKTMASIPIPLPDLQIQRRIAEIVKELFDHLDDGEALLARARDDLGTWRKALLKAAVTGELTADWRAANPPTETGADLLARILDERRARWQAEPRNKGKRYIEPVGPKTEDLGIAPPGWVWTCLDQLLDGIEAGLNVKCLERPPEQSETGLLKISAVTWWDFNENASKTLAEDHAHSDAWLISEGDLLISRANTLELVGSPAVVKKLTKRLMLSDKVLRLVVQPQLRDWIFYNLRSPQGRVWIESRSTGAQLSMRNISQDNLRQFPMLLPSSAELESINGELAAQIVVRGTLEKELRGDLAMSSTLRQSILSAAFRGDLVR